MKREIQSYSGLSAKIQYLLLMTLYRFVWSKWAYGYFARGLGHVFPASNSVDLVLNGGALFRIWLNDAYWTRFVLYHGDYEPELDHILSSCVGLTDTFCDLGANKGYWTVKAAKDYGTVIAVEASSQTYEALTDNTKDILNVKRHKSAIHSHLGKTLQFVNVHNSHASARLGQPGTHDQTETVSTTTVDHVMKGQKPALIKLDVEGAEIAAFEGAVQTLRAGSIFVYEDHGSDLTCETSAWFLNKSGFSVFAIENGMHPIKTIEDIQKIKTDPYKGYNFLAAQSNSSLLAGLMRQMNTQSKK